MLGFELPQIRPAAPPIKSNNAITPPLSSQEAVPIVAAVVLVAALGKWLWDKKPWKKGGKTA